jgi:serine/threonine protein phosphatase PrpC
MRPWSIVSATEQGSRPENDDQIAVATWKHLQRRYYSMAICDGVGSITGSGACARRIAARAIVATEAFVVSRTSARPLHPSEQRAFSDHLTTSLADADGPPSQATTFALTVFSDRSGFFVWAGDSRICALNDAGYLVQVTRDHHDQEGRIARFVRGDGTVVGGLETRYLEMDDVRAVLGTTDGIHDSCSREELRSFLVYCMAGRVADAETLQSDVRAFLSQNISDNATIGIVYKPISVRRAISTLRTKASA